MNFSQGYQDDIHDLIFITSGHEKKIPMQKEKKYSNVTFQKIF